MPGQIVPQRRGRFLLGAFIFLIILIVTSILYSNLVRPRIEITEATPEESMRTLCTAIEIYQQEYNSLPPDLSALGPSAGIKRKPSAGAACLIDPLLAGGNKNGYRYHYTALDSRKSGKLDSFAVTADPGASQGKGLRHYFMDGTCVVRFEVDKPATSISSPTR